MQRLAKGFGLWEGALYEIGGKTCTPPPAYPLWSLIAQFRNEEGIPLAIAPLCPTNQPPILTPLPTRDGAQTLVDDSAPWWLSEVLLGSLQDRTAKGRSQRLMHHPRPAGLVSPGILAEPGLSASLTHLLVSP